MAARTAGIDSYEETTSLSTYAYTMDSSIDMGVKKIMDVKHWLRSFSLLLF